MSPAAAPAPIHRIEARWEAGPKGPPDLRLDAPAPPPAAALLRGKTPEAALGLIPLVYNLCAGAQEAAARAALGLAQEPQISRRIAAEALREHALRCLKDWPEALGQEPNLKALIGIARLEQETGPARLAALEAALFGPVGLAFPDPVALYQRGESVPARALAAVAPWPAAWGADPAAPAPSMDPTLLRRVAGDARLAPLIKAERSPLLIRMLARLIDAARMIEILRGERPPLPPERLAPGVGAAEAARGRLIHRARLAAGRIADYAIETPTDAVMGANGMLSRMIASAGAAPRALRQTIARLAVLACDPCTPVTFHSTDPRETPQDA